MRLLDQLDDTAETSESMFRRVLAKEDARRIRALCDLAAQTPSIADYLKNGLYIGWTRDDMRTWELKDQLTPLMEAIYAFQRSEGVDKDAIVDYGLEVADTQGGTIGGLHNEFVYVGRIDNLASCHASIGAITSASATSSPSVESQAARPSASGATRAAKARERNLVINRILGI